MLRCGGLFQTQRQVINNGTFSVSKKCIPLSDSSKLFVQMSLDCQSVCQSVGVVQSAISPSRTPVVARGRHLAGR
jgi:hypothetical protein